MYWDIAIIAQYLFIVFVEVTHVASKTLRNSNVEKEGFRLPFFEDACPPAWP